MKMTRRIRKMKTSVVEMDIKEGRIKLKTWQRSGHVSHVKNEQMSDGRHLQNNSDEYLRQVSVTEVGIDGWLVIGIINGSQLLILIRFHSANVLLDFYFL